MITSIVGRLIKKPEVAERIQIVGKHVVNFTAVENRNRGERRLSVFFNLSVIIGTDAQFDLAMRLDKGTVLLFSAPRITYVRQSDRSENEQQQTINIYADADNFKIVAGAGEGGAASSSGGDMFAAPATVPSSVSRTVPSGRGATDLSDLSGLDNGLDDVDDPFADQEPAPHVPDRRHRRAVVAVPDQQHHRPPLAQLRGDHRRLLLRRRRARLDQQHAASPHQRPRLATRTQVGTWTTFPLRSPRVTCSDYL